MRLDILANLNQQQQEAVSYMGGPLLVLAGAGSGKTRVLTHRVANLVAKHGVNPTNILCVTFTNKAAGEMKSRITKLVAEAGVQGEPWASTYHSFCAKLLRIDGEKIGLGRDFVIYDTEDQKDVAKQVIARFNISEKKLNPGAILASISEAKNEMMSPLEYGEAARGSWQENIFKIYVEYEKILKESGALDFDDLLVKSVELLEKNPDVRAKWQHKLTHVLVDEWQDTNKAQYRLTKLLVGNGGNFTAVGDASQSIYRWRGADFRNVNNLSVDFPNLKVVNLDRNYRSTQIILDAANSVISKNKSHPVLKLWTDKTTGEKISIYQGVTEQDESQFVVENVIKLSNMFGVSRSEIAVLYRTNAQSRVVEEAFLHSGISYALVGGVKFYERKEVRDVICYLRLITNLKDSVSLKRAQSLGKRRFEKFEKFRQGVAQMEVRPTTLEIMDGVMETTEYLSKFDPDDAEDFARLENLRELRSVASEFPELNDFLEQVALVEGSDRTNQSGNGDGEKVTLMTVHSAKGLEFDSVFIVGMEEGLFPHSRSLFDVEELEEERRLAYVAMTRAKERLFITNAKRRLYFGHRNSNPPSRFIMDIPQDLLSEPVVTSSFGNFENDFDSETKDNWSW